MRGKLVKSLKLALVGLLGLCVPALAASVLNLGGGLLISYPLVTGRLLTNGGATLMATPANPAATASATFVMMGLGSTCAITPLNSTRLVVNITGTISNDTGGDGAQAQIRFGTGAAPANGAAPVGTAAGSGPSYIVTTGTHFVPWTSTVILTGLTVGTAYWLDVGLLRITGGNANVANLECSAHEI